VSLCVVVSVKVPPVGMQPWCFCRLTRTKHRKIFYLPRNTFNMITLQENLQLINSRRRNLDKVKFWNMMRETCFCSLQCTFAVSGNARISLFVPKRLMHSESIRIANLLIKMPSLFTGSNSENEYKYVSRLTR